MIKFAVLLALLVLSLHLPAQTVVSKQDSTTTISGKIDRYLQSAASVYKFNGVALVAKDGRILLHKAYGWKDVAAQVPDDTLTRFPILSITKSFTAMVLLKLQEEGKLSLKDPLSKYVPDFPEGRKITLEHLLTHASGIANYTDVIGEEDTAIVCHPVSRQQVLDLFYHKPLAFKPGKGFSYNNSGYFLCGMVIEKATGKPYEQNVRELIFDPLGMTHSGFDYNGLSKESKAVGYQFLNDSVQKPYPFLDSTVSYAAGAIYSTTGDLLKWAQAIARGDLLSTPTWKAALTPKNKDYGYGFQLGSFQNRHYIRHSGGYPGYVSEFTYYPDEACTIILLKNSGTYGEDLWPVTLQLSNILFGLPYDLWQPHNVVKLSEELLKEKEGTYISGKMRLRFYVQDGALQMRTPYGAVFPLQAESENLFFEERFNTSFRFVKDDKGKVTKLILRERGTEQEWQKGK